MISQITPSFTTIKANNSKNISFKANSEQLGKLLSETEGYALKIKPRGKGFVAFIVDTTEACKNLLVEVVDPIKQILMDPLNPKYIKASARGVSQEKAISNLAAKFPQCGKDVSIQTINPKDCIFPRKDALGVLFGIPEHKSTRQIDTKIPV